MMEQNEKTGTLVITGANSFIGRKLAKRAEQLGWRTVLVTRRGRDVYSAGNARFIELPMEEYDRLGTLAGPCDCFVHLAWNGTRGEARMDAELQRKNVEYSLRGVRSMLSAGCGRILSAGSQAEYGPHTERISEESACRPNTEYGKAKLDFYEKLSALCVRSGTAYKEPRFFSLYGPGDFSGTMILSVLRDMLRNRPCRLSEGRQMWDYLYIDDAVEGVMRLCERQCPDGVYNFGSGDARPLREYVEDMARLTRTQSERLYGAVPYPATGMVSLWPDVTKLRTELLWEPKVSFEKGIEAVLKWMAGNPPPCRGCAGPGSVLQ